MVWLLGLRQCTPLVETLLELLDLGHDVRRTLGAARGWAANHRVRRTLGVQGATHRSICMLVQG